MITEKIFNAFNFEVVPCQGRKKRCTGFPERYSLHKNEYVELNVTTNTSSIQSMVTWAPAFGALATVTP